MARKSRGNTTASFNSVALTNYCDQADLNATVEQLESTHLGSTGKESGAGDPEFKIKLGGNWDNALDNALSPEAITPGTKRTAVIAYVGSSATVTYTWTSNAEIQDFMITSKIGSFIKWTATLALSGAPTRTAA